MSANYSAMLHYLLHVCGLSANVVDQNLRSPLHIVCEHGHPEAFEYLIRKEGSTLQYTRIHTPIHV